MIVPYDKLSDDTLENLIREFVTRDGTDYGEREVSEEAKSRQVREQLRKGSVLIVFDAESESCNIMTKEQWREISSRAP
jgi:uncharacterized protein